MLFFYFRYKFIKLKGPFQRALGIQAGADSVKVCLHLNARVLMIFSRFAIDFSRVLVKFFMHLFIIK